MKITIDLTELTSFDIFNEILSVKRKTNLFKDLRKIFARQTIKAITKSGIKTQGQVENIAARLSNNAVEISPIPSLYDKDFLDLYFCAGYGVSYYSLSAVSYQHRPYEELPSLDTFYKRKNYSIGNFGFLVENGDYEIEVLTNESIKIVGYSSQINAKKKKSFIAILGVYFDYELLSPVFEKFYNDPKEFELIDVKLTTINYPAIFMCRNVGKLFVCNCFKDHINWQSDFKRFSNVFHEEILSRIDAIEYKEGICHYCTKEIPNIENETTEFSSFLNRYMPYFRLENKKRFGDIFHFVKEDNVIVENELRENFGYPKIGERWITETHLYYLIKEIFPELNPIFHYRGVEMEGLELDIFIPELKLGVEYQGEQHYQVIEHWGGEEGLKKRENNDKRKIELCKMNDYTFVEFTHSDNLNKDLVIDRIEKLRPTRAFAQAGLEFKSSALNH